MKAKKWKRGKYKEKGDEVANKFEASMLKNCSPVTLVIKFLKYQRKNTMFADELIRSACCNETENSMILAKGLTMCVRFKVDNVAQYVHENLPPGDIPKPYCIKKHIPNVAPLAPMMWFEYNGLSVSKNSSREYGCLLTIDYGRDEKLRAGKWKELDIPSERRWIMRAEYFCKEERGIGVSDWIYFISVGNEGEILGVNELASTRWDQEGAIDGKTGPDDTERNKWHEEIVVALTSICFAHCKGAEIKEDHPSRQVRRAAERSGKPVFSHHTINIHPATKVLREEGNVEKNGIAKALHITRGHFACYTEDNPLFGKHVGTFYRPMHVRGNAEKGIVGKDYRVHPE